MDKLYTVDQVAIQLNLAKGTIFNWVHQRKIPYIKIGGALRFLEADIKKLVSESYVKKEA